MPEPMTPGAVRGLKIVLKNLEQETARVQALPFLEQARALPKLVTLLLEMLRVIVEELDARAGS